MDASLVNSIPCLGVIALVLFLFLSSSLKIIREYEAGVIFRLGRFVGVKRPGLILILPMIDQLIKVDLRPVELDIPSEETISSDRIAIEARAAVYFRVIDPGKAIIQVEDYQQATWKVSQDALRKALNQNELDNLLFRREEIDKELKRVIDEQTRRWGVEVSLAEIKNVKKLE